MGRIKKTRLREWPRVRRVELKTKTAWIVDTGSLITPRIRKKFEDAEAAESYAERLSLEHRHEGLSAFTLNVGQKDDARSALEILSGLNVSLREVAEFYRKHHQPIGGVRTLREVFDEMLAFKRDVQKKRPTYIADLKARLHNFLQCFGDRQIIEVTSTELHDWLYSNTAVTELTRSNVYRYVSLLFSYAQGKRDRRHPTAKTYRVDNPMHSVTRPSFELAPPKILTVEQAERLLRAAAATQEKLNMLPYVVLGLFCGVRSEELRGLTWGDVKLSKGEVTIPARIAKKRRMRNIPLPKNALTWLLPFKDATGPVTPKNSAKKVPKVATAAGFSEWPHNALRHSFGSYLFALTEDSQVTSARLGQKSDDVLFTHYRSLTGKHEAKAFFNLTRASVLSPKEEASQAAPATRKKGPRK